MGSAWSSVWGMENASLARTISGLCCLDTPLWGTLRRLGSPRKADIPTHPAGPWDSAGVLCPQHTEGVQNFETLNAEMREGAGKQGRERTQRKSLQGGTEQHPPSHTNGHLSLDRGSPLSQPHPFLLKAIFPPAPSSYFISLKSKCRKPPGNPKERSSDKSPDH